MPRNRIPTGPITLSLTNKDYRSPDLGRDIGSGRWFGELSLLVVLIAVPIAGWVALEKGLQPPVAISASPPPVRHLDLPRRRAIVTEAELQPRESLSALLMRLGVFTTDASRADALVTAALFPDTVPQGLRVAVRWEHAAGDGLARITLRPRLDLALSLERNGGGDLTLERHPIPIETVTQRIAGTVTSDLAGAILASGGAVQAAEQFRAAMTQRVEPGDRFDMVTTLRRAADGASEAGDVLYAALSRDGRPVTELLRWGNDGRFRTAANAGASGSGTTATLWPVNGRFTSGYGLRFHPILGYARLHAGVDIGAPSGAPIYAVADGVVRFAGRHGGHGNYVRLDHPDGHGTGYAHMSRIAVADGDLVESGQVIGYVGSTGLSTGPHLHYEVYRGGRSVDPMGARFAKSDHANDREQFETAVAALKALSPIVPAIR